MRRLSILLSAGAAAASSVAHAAVPHQTCVPRAVGVPTRPGPPNWFDPPPPSGSGDPTLDDPRWNEANGQSFHLGGAEAPLHTRSLWANVGGQDFLYLSFISDLAPDTTLPRSIFLGFRRAHSDNGVFGYIFEFHLGAASAGNAQALAYCGQYSMCSQTANWYRVFADFNQGDGSCNDDTVHGERYSPFNGATINTPPSPWMNSSVHFWQLGATGALQNRWAVQIRIPFSATPPAWQASHAYAVNDRVTNGGNTYRCITAGTSAGAGGPSGTGTNITDGTAHWTIINALDLGIEKGSTYWYEETENPTIGAPYTSVAKFPTADATFSGVTTSICVNSATLGGDSLVHAELGGGAACTTCNLQAFGGLVAFGASPPPGASCDGGLRIDPGNIGSLYDPPSHPTFNIDTDSPPNEFSAPKVNKVIAQVHNTTSAPIDVPLMARFRLANWGTTVFSPGSTDIGIFGPIPGTENGVCAVGSPPSCSGSFAIPASGQKAITFDWTLSDADKCVYQIPGAACDNTCVCDHTGTSPCDPDPATPVGTLGTRPTGTTTCLKKRFPHQCMYVELTAPNGGVTFVQQAAYANMDFGALSVLAREALIDGRKLPTVPGQRYQDIYLLVMPRNMPASVPPTTTTVSLVQQAAITAALRVAQPYIDDLDRIPPEQITSLVGRVGDRPLALRVSEQDERVRKILRARQVMSRADLQRVDTLLGVASAPAHSNTPSSDQVHNAVAKLGPEAAAEVVPTLDVYPFYLPGARGHIYQPMTAFTLFLSHEATLSGMRYEIDGATRVRQNVYHLRIPVGTARKIQVRTQALVGNEGALPPGNPRWPCGCCGGARCGLVSSLGNTVPGLVAGVFVVGRRRRRKPSTRAR